MSLKPGLYEDVSSESYFADPCERPSLSQSIAHTLVSKSPLHAWAQHPKFGDHGKKPTKEMDLGSIVHLLLLGRGRRFKIIRPDGEGEEEYQDYKKKKAKEARDLAREAGFIPLLPKQYEAAVEVANGIKPEIAKWGIKLSGKSELTAVWEERASDGTTVLCRGGLDHFIEDDGLIVDLKIVRSAHPKAIQAHLAGFGGDIQGAAYTSAVEKLRPHLAGRAEFLFLFCEAEFPHAVTPAYWRASMRELGERRWQRAVNSWARCLRENRWRAYVEEPIAPEAPPWALAAELEHEFSDTTSNPKPNGSSDWAASHVAGDNDGNGYGIEDIERVF